MYAAQNNFTITLLLKAPDSLDDDFRLQRTRPAPGIWNNAIGAKGITSILDLNKRARSMPKPCDGKVLEGAGSRKTLNNGQGWAIFLPRFGQLWNLVLEGIANHIVYPGHGGKDLGNHLSVAACDYHKRVLVAANHFSCELPRLHGRFSSDRACVDYTKICVGFFVYGMPSLAYKLL
jgi:hypothetical protein